MNSYFIIGLDKRIWFRSYTSDCRPHLTDMAYYATPLPVIIHFDAFTVVVVWDTLFLNLFLAPWLDNAVKRYENS